VVAVRGDLDEGPHVVGAHRGEHARDGGEEPAVLERGVLLDVGELRPVAERVAASSTAGPVPIEKPSTMMSSGRNPRVSTSQS